MRTPVFSHRAARLRILKQEWQKLIDELGHRGEGRRESGAFLLGDRGDTTGRVRRVVYYDDLDPNSLQGIISFSGFGYSALSDLCADEKLSIVADAHTHPGKSVRQSPSDQANPMAPKVGHVALIIPNFATRFVTASDVGVHEYFGDAGWKSHFGRHAKRLLYVGRWA
jgi:hypothetical protein